MNDRINRAQLLEEGWDNFINDHDLRRFREARLIDVGWPKDSLDIWHPSWTPRPMVIWGPPGTGKTHAAIAICRRWFEAHTDDYVPEVRFINVSDWLRRMVVPTGLPRVEDLGSAQLLVLDDLANDNWKKSEYTLELLTRVMDLRYNNGGITIATTNCRTGKQLAERLGEPLASRIWDRAHFYVMDGGNKRKPGPTIPLGLA